MSKIKTQEEIGAVHLEKKGLDKDRFKNLIKGHEVYCKGIEKSLSSEDLFIENWFVMGEYVWLSDDKPSSSSKLITLDELEEMITGGNKTEKSMFKTGDKVRVKSIFNTQRGYGWDEDMVDVGGCFFVGTYSSYKVEDKKHPHFSYHVDDLELVEEEETKTLKVGDKKVISAEEAQSIINIACSDWKPKLADLWAVNIVQGKDVEITEYFYKEMRGACTKEQHELFDKIFGEDEPESPYQDGELIFIRTSNYAEWSLRYSTGKINKNGYAEVYNNQKLYTENTTPFKFHAKAPNVKLPE